MSSLTSDNVSKGSEIAVVKNLGFKMICKCALPVSPGRQNFFSFVALHFSSQVSSYPGCINCMVTTGTGKHGKPGKMGRHFLQSGKSQGILSRLKKSGNCTQNTGKIEKNYTGKLKKILKKPRKFVSQ